MGGIWLSYRLYLQARAFRKALSEWRIRPNHECLLKVIVPRELLDQKLGLTLAAAENSGQVDVANGSHRVLAAASAFLRLGRSSVCPLDDFAYNLSFLIRTKTTTDLLIGPENPQPVAVAQALAGINVDLSQVLDHLSP
jgi:hypothetical protein